MKYYIWNKIKELDGWCDEDRCHYIVDLITDEQPCRMVEVGVYGGRSLIAMALAAKTYGGRVVGIDPWTNEANLEGEPNEHREFWEKLDINGVYLRFVAAVLKLGLDCQHIRARGEEAITLFTDSSINFLSLDGNHSEESSCRDVQLWMPKIAPGGHLMMDDTGWSSMQKAVQMVLAAGFKRVHDTGSWSVFRR